MIIDSYSHALYGGYLEKLADSGGEWTMKTAARERSRAANMPSMLDMKLRVDLLDRFGIDYQVVVPSDFWDIDRMGEGPDARLKVVQVFNDNMASILESGRGRLLPIGIMSLLDFGPAHEREMERAIKYLGLKGFCIQSNINGKAPDQFEAFWRQAQELDVPVYIHPQNPIGTNDRSYEAEYGLIHALGWPYETSLALARLVFSGVMERYPRLKVVSHHLGGGMIPFFWGRISSTYGPESREKVNARSFSKPLIEYFSRFYYDTAVGGNAAAIRCAYEVFGANQMIFATDAPFGGTVRLETYPGVVRSLGLQKTENNKIFEENIRKVLNMT